MLFLADFLDTLLRGAVLAGVSLALGGLAWQLWVGRPWQHRVPEAAVRRGLTLLAWGAVVVAAAQALLLVLKALVLSDSFGRDALGSFVVTLHFIAAADRGKTVELTDVAEKEIKAALKKIGLRA